MNVYCTMIPLAKGEKTGTFMEGVDQDKAVWIVWSNL